MGLSMGFAISVLFTFSGVVARYFSAYLSSHSRIACLTIWLLVKPIDLQQESIFDKSSLSTRTRSVKSFFPCVIGGRPILFFKLFPPFKVHYTFCAA